MVGTVDRCDGRCRGTVGTVSQGRWERLVRSGRSVGGRWERSERSVGGMVGTVGAVSWGTVGAVGYIVLSLGSRLVAAYHAFPWRALSCRVAASWLQRSGRFGQ